MKTDKNRIIFYILIGLQIVFLAGMGGARLFPLVFGKKILLKPVPVDPRDFFRGEYVHLRYDISEIETREKIESGMSVYVLLEKEEKYWKQKKVSVSRSALALKNKDDVVIKGEVSSVRKKTEYVLTDLRDLNKPGWMTMHRNRLERWNGVEYIWNDKTNARSIEQGERLTLPIEEYNSEGGTTFHVIESDIYYLNSPDVITDQNNRIFVSALVSEIRYLNEGEVEFGIESWFVPEGEAITYQRNLDSAHVSVDDSGNAYLSSVDLSFNADKE